MQDLAIATAILFWVLAAAALLLILIAPYMCWIHIRNLRKEQEARNAYANAQRKKIIEILAYIYDALNTQEQEGLPEE